MSCLPHLLCNFSGGKGSSIPYRHPKFNARPGCVNRKIINYQIDTVDALNKRATTSIHSDSERKFVLTSEVLLTFVRLTTGYLKSCGWEVFNVPIVTTGSIKEILAHYGEITLLVYQGSSRNYQHCHWQEVAIRR